MTLCINMPHKNNDDTIEISISDCRNLLNIATKQPFLVLNIEATTRCSVKKVFLKISQNSKENTCAKVSFLNKVPDFGTGVLL